MKSWAKSHTRLVILAVLVLLTSAGVAVAAIPAQNGTISGCYDSKGNLRVIDTGQSCAKNETPLAWNQQGPPGTPGTPGEDGDKGDPGEPGPGLASVDDLDGLPCRVGSPDEGVLEVGYAAVSGSGRDVSFTCRSTTLYALTVTHTTGGTVTGGPISCGTTCTASFAPGGEVDLAATASPGYEFTGWTGACSGTGACSFTMDADRQVGATFTRTFLLEVQLSQFSGITNPTVGLSSQPTGLSPCSVTGNGSVYCSGRFLDGTQVTLTKTGGGSILWGLDCTGVSTTCTVTLDRPRQVSADSVG